MRTMPVSALDLMIALTSAAIAGGVPSLRTSSFSTVRLLSRQRRYDRVSVATGSPYSAAITPRRPMKLRSFSEVVSPVMRNLATPRVARL